METTNGVTVNNGSPEEDIGVLGPVEKGNRIVKAAERRVGTLELEI